MSDFHTWAVTPHEAIAIQKSLRNKVKIEPFTGEIKYIGGADVSLNRFSDTIYAGIIVLSFPDLRPIIHSVLKAETKFPYIPGLLSFREAPALIECWNALKIKPDILVVDGQGIAHPRRMGIASHIGALLDVPTIGCAKSILYGVHGELNPQAGSATFLFDRYNTDEVIGAILRTKNKVKPVIISPGHKTGIEDALDIIKHCVRGYRIPEPTRLAHELVNQFRRGELNP